MKKRNNRLPFSPDVDKEKKKKQQTVTAQIKHRERKKDSWICMEKTTNN